jgi:hypothetical protein
MVKMKRWVIGLLLAAIIAGGVGIAQAATSGTFQITITVSYIGITLKDRTGGAYGTWTIGSVTGSAVSTMDANTGGEGDEGVQVDNTSNVAIDLATYATNTASWTLDTSPAEDHCVLKATAEAAWQGSPYPDMSEAAIITSTGGAGDMIASNVSSGTEQYLYYSLMAPSSVTSGAANTFTVTVKATAH